MSNVQTLPSDSDLYIFVKRVSPWKTELILRFIIEMET